MALRIGGPGLPPAPTHKPVCCMPCPQPPRGTDTRYTIGHGGLSAQPGRCHPGIPPAIRMPREKRARPIFPARLPRVRHPSTPAGSVSRSGSTSLGRRGFRTASRLTYRQRRPRFPPIRLATSPLGKPLLSHSEGLAPEVLAREGVIELHDRDLHHVEGFGRDDNVHQSILGLLREDTAI